MNKNWMYFIGAAALAGFYLLRAGAPPTAVIAGIAGTAMFMRRKSRAA